MIKAIWFMVKVGVLVALALWVAENPGFVEMAWLDYKLRIHVGVFLIALIAVILLSIFLYRAIRTFVDFPKSFRRYQEVKHRDKGYRALTLGLTAVGTTMWAGYALEGSHIDENGFLQEPFHLLATGWFLNGAGLLGLIFWLSIFIMKRRSS